MSALIWLCKPTFWKCINISRIRMALADAQNIAIRKLLTRAVFDSIVTPGPPLPKSHPSPALAAKLHLECAALYRSARALVNTPGSSRPNLSSLASKSKFRFGLGNKDRDIMIPAGREEQGEEVIPELKRYLSDEITLHDALAHKWLGVDNGENGGQQQSGIAVGFLTWSKKELEDLKNGSSAGGVGIATDREKDMREARKARVQKELESVNVFLKGYKRMNDSVSSCFCICKHMTAKVVHLDVVSIRSCSIRPSGNYPSWPDGGHTSAIRQTCPSFWS